jgi:hypothetical protein
MHSKNQFLFRAFTKQDFIFVQAFLTNNVCPDCSCCTVFSYLCTLNFQIWQFMFNHRRTGKLGSSGQNVQECEATEVNQGMLPGTKSFKISDEMRRPNLKHYIN